MKDTGIGINPEARQDLFQAFTQADGSTTRKYGGTGLGLCISRQLVELMDGQIGVESDVGQGSTFWFTAVLEKPPVETRAIEPVSASLDQLRVLIVDDNATNRRILCGQLACWGMNPSECESGKEALRYLREANEAENAFHLAILDLMMPEMDGFELARLIKVDPAIAQIPLVMLTSFGARNHQQRAREVGVAACPPKPVRQTHLHDCLKAVLGGVSAGFVDGHDES